MVFFSINTITGLSADGLGRTALILLRSPNTFSTRQIAQARAACQRRTDPVCARSGTALGLERTAQPCRGRISKCLERIIHKGDRDEMLRQLSREISKCVKRQSARAAQRSCVYRKPHP